MPARNLRVLEELRKELLPTETSEGSNYSYTEYVIDGRRYGSMSGNLSSSIEDLSPEHKTLKAVISLFESSTEKSTRDFAKIICELEAKAKAKNIPLAQTELYRLAKECEIRSLRTTPKSTEREILLLSFINRAKPLIHD